MSCNQREDRWGATLSVICTSFKTSFPLSFSLSLPPFSISLSLFSLSLYFSWCMSCKTSIISLLSLSLSLSLSVCLSPSLSLSLSLSPLSISPAIDPPSLYAFIYIPVLPLKLSLSLYPSLSFSPLPNYVSILELSPRFQLTPSSPTLKLNPTTFQPICSKCFLLKAHFLYVFILAVTIKFLPFFSKDFSPTIVWRSTDTV